MRSPFVPPRCKHVPYGICPTCREDLRNYMGILRISDPHGGPDGRRMP